MIISMAQRAGSLKIDKQSLDMQAAALLKQRILDGELPAGARLKEASLAIDTGLSRGTIRSALHQLRFEGLVEQTPYAGWSVASLSVRDAWELHSLRSVLEGLAARLAAGAAPDLRDTLHESFDSLVVACEAGDAEEIVMADLALHARIVEISGHERLAHHYSIVKQQSRVYVRSSNRLLNTPVAVVDQHRPLVEAVCSGDAELAESLAQRHNDEEGKVLVEHLLSEEPSG
jgi:DNA-binding GntR family transcriptional regulator